MQQFFAHTNFQEGESYLFYPCLQQRIDSDSSILFICILTNFYEVEMQFPQLGSCKYRCAYMNRVVGTSIFTTFTLQGLFSFFLFFSLCAQKAQKNTKRLQANKNKKGGQKTSKGKKITCLFAVFLLLLVCIFVLFVLFVLLVLLVHAESFRKKKRV